MLLVALIIITVALVAAALAAPFRRPRERSEQSRGGELEEAKLVKYRELRDLEFDWHTGKLSDTDYQRTKGQLRAEAAQLLEQSETAAPPLAPVELETSPPRGTGANEADVIEVSGR